MMRSLTVVVALSTCLLTVQAWACPGWATIQKKIRATFKKDRPSYKILGIKRDGAVRNYTGKMRQGKRVVTVKFCSQGVKVAVKRDNGTEVTFGSSWHYQQLKGRWNFHHQAAGTVVEKAAPGQALPPRPRVKQLIAEAWVSQMDKTDKVDKVLMTKPQKVGVKIIYKTLVDVYFVDKGGKKMVCKDFRVQLFKGKRVEGVATYYGTGDGPWEASFGNQSKFPSSCKPQ